MTCRIHRSVAPEAVVFTLSGEVDEEQAVRLQELVASEEGRQIVLDLGDVTLVDRAAVLFLADIEAAGVRLVECPVYVRSWIAAERSHREPDDREPPS